MWIKNGHWLLICVRPLYPLWDCTRIESDPSKLDTTGVGTKCPKMSAEINEEKQWRIAGSNSQSRLGKCS